MQPATVAKIVREIGELARSPLEGIKVSFSQDDDSMDDLSEIKAVVFGPEGTPYAGGCFNVTLRLEDDYPQQPPKGFFLTKIFHPNVATNGEICVNTLKRDWKPTHCFKEVLMVIKCLLIVPNPESALNEEAGKLLLEDYESYCRQARLMTSIHAAKPPTATTDIPPSTNKDYFALSSGTRKTVRRAKTKTGCLVGKQKSLKRL